MPVTTDELVQHSQSLLNTASNEPEYRNVVSKSYYAMYHSVLSILENQPPRYGGEGVHASLISYLESYDVKTCERHNPMSLKALAIVLAQYKDKRVIADYKLDLTVTKEQAEDIANAAARLKGKCDILMASLAQ
ncbi:TPA: hypothetical protein VGS95_002085 [Vibrio parahaemolyticus]|nr:hypothetical protein [Vibrio parahaemolyticus]